MQLALQFLSRVSLEQVMHQQHHLHFTMSKAAKERAKELEFLSLSQHNLEGSTDKEDSVHATHQNLTGNITKKEQLILMIIEYLITILLTPTKAKNCSLK